MIQAQPAPLDTLTATVWGLTPVELHDRYWAARGVQVVRCGEPIELADGADLFLLTDATTLVSFRLSQIADTLTWLRPRVMLLRVHSSRELGYQERLVTDDDDRFLRFKRTYDRSDIELARAAVTTDRGVAMGWSRQQGAQCWRELRHNIAQTQRATVSIPGQAYQRDDEADVNRFIRELVRVWTRPDATISRARRLIGPVWADSEGIRQSEARFVGPVWVGKGRSLDRVQSVVGPAVLWDDPDHRPAADPIDWDEIEPIDPKHPSPRTVKPSITSSQRLAKRTFDIVFATIGLLITLPLYPLVMLAIWIEDGRPFFFSHERETLGARKFPCIKFRSMRNDAEQIKQRLRQTNQADGPQFYMENDPRLTRVGRTLRKLNIDELPQLLNVLVGHMSLVGPRPSPFNENQYCPGWREARLSVRPGITGMWQVHRSRREGEDFQEWIKYDLHYVENMSFKLDMKLIYLTIRKHLHIG